MGMRGRKRGEAVEIMGNTIKLAWGYKSPGKLEGLYRLI
jgi:hypothetical protein